MTDFSRFLQTTTFTQEQNALWRNSGEQVLITSATGAELISFFYKDGLPWPAAADGLGNSLVAYTHNPEGNHNLSSYWKASSQVGGSPGQDDPAATWLAKGRCNRVSVYKGVPEYRGTGLQVKDVYTRSQARKIKGTAVN